MKATIKTERKIFAYVGKSGTFYIPGQGYISSVGTWVTSPSKEADFSDNDLYTPVYEGDSVTLQF